MQHVAANNVDLRHPIARGHRRQFRLHDADRRHGPDRYEIPPREPIEQPGGAHPQYFQWHWQCINNRWVWLRPNPVNLRRSRCIVCHVNFNSNIGSVRTHETSGHHRTNMRPMNVPLDPIFDVHLDPESFANEKAAIIILLCTWFADEGVAYRKINTLLPLIKRIARHPGALQEVKLTRTTMSKIIKNIIAPVHKQELAETLARSKFSTLFDESTGISKDKSGCLLIRFADDHSYRIRTTLWDMIPVYSEDNAQNDETAQALYDLIIGSLFGQQKANEERRVVLQENNYMASSTDGCNTMVGIHNSVRQRLLVNFEGSNHITCPCHGAHLCSRHASEAFFPEIMQLLQNCYNWFASAKRLHRLQENQIDLNLDVHRLLRFVETRWLTGLPSLYRIREQITAIDMTLAEVPNNQQAVNLLQQLRSPAIRCRIDFLAFILEVPEDFNGWMQSEEVIFPEVFNRLCTDLKDILLCYMREDYVENANLEDMNFIDPDNILHYDDMRIGENARELAQQLPRDDYLNFMETARRYLIHLATEWLELLVRPWARYQCTESLLRDNALSQDYHLDNPNVIHELVQQFPRALPHRVNEEILQMEWEIFVHNEPHNLQLPDNLRTDRFWFIVGSIDDGEGFYPYRELAEFVRNILCTPHSNAQPERIWSLEKYIKNKWRNRLSSGSVKSMLAIKEMLALCGCSKKVHRFIPNIQMIARVRFRIYDIQEDIPDIIPDADNENDQTDSESDGDEEDILSSGEEEFDIEEAE